MKMITDSVLVFFLFRKRRTCIFPAEGRFAALAVNVGHGVQARQQDALLGRTTAHVHPKFKKKTMTNDLKNCNGIPRGALESLSRDAQSRTPLVASFGRRNCL